MRLAVAAILLFLAAPTLVVIPTSFSSSPFLTFPPPGFSLQWYERYFSSAAWIGATQRSLLIATLTALLSSIVGVSAALAMRRMGAARQWVQLLILTPMIIPGIIIAIGAYGLFADLGLIGTALGLTIAHTLVAFPFVTIVVSSAVDKIDPSIEFAAASLGARPASTLFLVVLPLIRPALVSGALLAFITSFDEVVITVFVGGSRSSTLPKMMWDSIRTEVDPTISAISVILVLVTIIVLFLLSRLSRGTEK